MTYLEHRILPTGWIELREENEDGTSHRSTIPPNKSIPGAYKAQIESDENFSKYRTQENADAYEAKLKELEPTAEELAQQEEKRLLQEKREQVKAELKAAGSLEHSIPAIVERMEKLEIALEIRDPEL